MTKNNIPLKQYLTQFSGKTFDTIVPNTPPHIEARKITGTGAK